MKTPEDRWGAVVVQIPRRLEDELIGSVDGVCLGTETRSLPSDRRELRIYTESEEAAGAVAERVRSWMLRNEGGGSIRIEGVADGRWVERYQAGLRPFPLGSGFLIDPGGSGASEPGRSSILLVPGRAFGTGEHPTTRLCAEQLERIVAPGSRWLDLGCGSALLSIVASRCGATRIHGVDHDPEALEVARKVLAANALEQAVTLGDHVGSEVWDGVVVNISARFLVERASELASRIVPGGWLVVSGYESESVSEVAAALDAAGFREERFEARGEWCVSVRRAGLA